MPTAFRFLPRFPSLNLRYFLTLLDYEQSCPELCYPLATHCANCSLNFLLPTHYSWTLLNLLVLKHNFLQLLLHDFLLIQNACLLTTISTWYTFLTMELNLYSIFNNEILHGFSMQVFSWISGDGIPPHHLQNSWEYMNHYLSTLNIHLY